MVPGLMSSSVARSPRPVPLRQTGRLLRVAFLGSEAWLDGSAPAAPGHGVLPECFSTSGPDGLEETLAALDGFRPDVTVIFDPLSVPIEACERVPGITLGIIVAGVSEAQQERTLDGLDRLLSFMPSLTGTRIAGSEVWRAIPPPVSDALFSEVRPLHHSPRAMSIGRSTPHREAMLMPAKHHHDLLQVIHGVSGRPMIELLEEHDVGVYVAREPGGGFSQQIGVHLAAGHLLLAEPLSPVHGLERDIDYLQFDSPEGLVWMLDRLGRFPEMHQHARVRGRLKAEQYRASRLFARVAHDLLADVSAFGPG
jgi:hypothetical protein